MLKISIHRRTGEVITSTYSHADGIGRGKGYDQYVRAIYWAEKNLIYFRFPFREWTEENSEDAREVAENAKAKLEAKGLIPKKVKALFWEVGKGITHGDIKL